MFPVKGAVFLEFQLFLGIPPVFFGGIITPFALSALQGYQFHRGLFACHVSTSHANTKTSWGFNPQGSIQILEFCFAKPQNILKFQNLRF
jgi:hypothetical protein